MKKLLDCAMLLGLAVVIGCAFEVKTVDSSATTPEVEVLEIRYKQGPYVGLYMDVPKVEYKLVERASSQ